MKKVRDGAYFHPISPYRFWPVTFHTDTRNRWKIRRRLNKPWDHSDPRLPGEVILRGLKEGA